MKARNIANASNFIIRALIYGLLMAIFGCTGKVPDKCRSFQSEYSKIMSSGSTARDTPMLINKLGEFINNDSSCVDAWLTRGDIYLGMDSAKLAFKDYSKVVLLDTSNVYALYKIGLGFQLEEADDSALLYYTKAIRLKYYKGTLTNYFETPKGYSNNRSKYDIDFNLICLRMGEIFYYKRNFEASLSYFNICISNKFMLDKCYLYRGSLSLEQGNMTMACGDFQQSIVNGGQDAKKYIELYCNK